MCKRVIDRVVDSDGKVHYYETFEDCGQVTCPTSEYYKPPDER